MERLMRSNVEPILAKVKPLLSPDNALRIAGLVDLFAADGTVSISVARQGLFPTSSPATGNRAIDRLVKAVNKVAEEQGFAIRLRIDSDKKLADDRKVWFEGSPPTPVARTPVLDAISLSSLIADQQAQNVSWPNSIVLLTFNDHEFQAVQKAFVPLGEPRCLTDGQYRLGELQGMTILHCHSLQGQGPGKAQALATNIIRQYRPKAVLGIGIAAGLAGEREQAIGEVLVAKSIRDVDLRRLNHDGSETFRGETHTISNLLLQRFEALRLSNSGEGKKYPITLTRFLSGSDLVDNFHEIRRLQHLDSKAGGYEMEGYGLAEAAHASQTDWTIVKAISDWGDGTKAENKEQRQQQAAENAADTIYRALQMTPPLYGNGMPPERPRPKLRDPVPEDDYISGIHGTTQAFDDTRAARSRQGVPVLKALREWVDDPRAPSLFVLLGDYGMGKTVTCQRLYQELHAAHDQDRTNRDALYFDLRNLTHLSARVPSLNDILGDCVRQGWSNFGEQQSAKDFVLTQMERGAIAIFDGLDEALVKLNMADGQILLRSILQLRDDFMDRFPNAARPVRILLSCRTQYFRSFDDQRAFFNAQDRHDIRGEDYRVLELLPFSIDQVERYLANRMPADQLPSVMGLIRSVHNLEELSQRPYTLKLIRDFLPDLERDWRAGRQIHGVSLYQKMVERWLARDAGKHHIRTEDKQALAYHLAAYLWRQRTDKLPINDLEDWFHDWLGQQSAGMQQRYQRISAEQLEEDLRTATFLSREDDDGLTRGQFRFAHTSLAEYFLARYLLDAIEVNDRKRWEMAVPSAETLDFLGQLLAADAPSHCLPTLTTWGRGDAGLVNQLIFAYALRAQKKNYPLPNLTGINLSGAMLADRVIIGFTLSGAKFRNTHLRGCRFEQVILDGSDFTGSFLAQAEFNKCSLENVNFSETILDLALFRYCKMTSASATGAIGSLPKFIQCDVEYLDGVVGRGASVPLPSKTYYGLFWEYSLHTIFSSISNDGSFISTILNNGMLALWGVETGEIVWEIFLGQRLQSCSFSCDDEHIIVLFGRNQLALVNKINGKLARTISLEIHSDYAFQRMNGDFILATKRREVILASNEGEFKHKIFEDNNKSYMVVNFIREKEIIVFSSPQGGEMCNVGNGGVRIFLDNYRSNFRMYIDESKYILSGVFYESPQIHDEDEIIETIDNIIPLKISSVSDNKIASFFSSNCHGAIKIDEKKYIRKFSKTCGAIIYLSPSAEDEFFVSISGGEMFFGKGNSVDFCRNIRDFSLGSKISRFGKYLIRVGVLGMYTIENLKDRIGIASYEHSGAFFEAAFSEDERVLAVAENDEVFLRNTSENVDKTVHIGQAVACMQLSFSQSGKYLAAKISEENIKIFKADGSGIQYQNKYNGSIKILPAWGDIFAIIGVGKEIILFDSESVTEIDHMPCRGVERIAICAHKKIIAIVIGGDLTGKKTIVLIEYPSRQEIRRFEIPAESITAMELSQSGSYLMVGTWRGLIYRWDLSAGELDRMYGFTREGGWAIWDPRDNRILDAVGDVWRCLKWRRPGDFSQNAVVPLEYFGPVCRDWPEDHPAHRN